MKKIDDVVIRVRWGGRRKEEKKKREELTTDEIILGSNLSMSRSDCLAFLMKEMRKSTVVMNSWKDNILLPPGFLLPSLSDFKHVDILSQ